MNAGGVPNTCKSNEDAFQIPSGWRDADLVADGGVMYEQPAFKRGITVGNDC